MRFDVRSPKNWTLFFFFQVLSSKNFLSSYTIKKSICSYDFELRIFSSHIFLCWMYCRRMPWSVVQWRVHWYLPSLTVAETRLWQMPLQVVPLRLLQSSSTISPEQTVLLFARNYVICSFCHPFLWCCKLLRIKTEFQ